MKPTPNLGVAYHLVAEDEQQRTISAVKRPDVEAAAFQISVQNRMVVDHKQPKKKPMQRDGK